MIKYTLTKINCPAKLCGDIYRSANFFEITYAGMSRVLLRTALEKPWLEAQHSLYFKTLRLFLPFELDEAVEKYSMSTKRFYDDVVSSLLACGLRRVQRNPSCCMDYVTKEQEDLKVVEKQKQEKLDRRVAREIWKWPMRITWKDWS